MSDYPPRDPFQQQFGDEQNPYASPPGGSQLAIDPFAKVKGPAIGLIVAAVLGAVAGVLNVGSGAFGLVAGSMGVFDASVNGQPLPVNEMDINNSMPATVNLAQSIGGIVFGIIQVIVGAWCALGASKMQKLEAYNQSKTASILMMIPCLSGCCLVGLPVGIWSLTVLNNPQIKGAFRS